MENRSRLGRRAENISNNSTPTGDDTSYLVLVETAKKQEAIDTIHNLIIENKETYKDKVKFENKQIEFDENRHKFLMDYGYSGYVYEISHVNGRSMLYAYLSADLVEKVKELPIVISCSPDRKVHLC